MTTRLAFERSTSPLYQSNDGRLRVEHPNSSDWTVYDRERQEVALFTHSRLLCDAFIAGYDRRDSNG